jgi:hypothetical protein
LFEIPVRLQETPQSLLLKVEGGGGGTDSVTDSLLAVTIAVPVTPTEEMLVRMTMQADTLQIAMWSDAEPLRHAIEVRYGELRAKLEQDGFRVAGIKVTPLALRRDVPYQPKGLIRTSV